MESNISYYDLIINASIYPKEKALKDEGYYMYISIDDSLYIPSPSGFYVEIHIANDYQEDEDDPCDYMVNMNPYIITEISKIKEITELDAIQYADDNSGFITNMTLFISSFEQLHLIMKYFSDNIDQLVILSKI